MSPTTKGRVYKGECVRERESERVRETETRDNKADDNDKAQTGGLKPPKPRLAARERRLLLSLSLSPWAVHEPSGEGKQHRPSMVQVAPKKKGNSPKLNLESPLTHSETRPHSSREKHAVHFSPFLSFPLAPEYKDKTREPK